MFNASEIIIIENNDIDLKTYINYKWVKWTKFLLAVIYMYYVGHLDDIPAALKPLKKLKKIEINLCDHFMTSWII